MISAFALPSPNVLHPKAVLLWLQKMCDMLHSNNFDQLCHSVKSSDPGGNHFCTIFPSGMFCTRPELSLIHIYNVCRNYRSKIPIFIIKYSLKK